MAEPNAWGELRDQLDALLERLSADHERAAARERVIDRLHEENQRLRAGEVRLVLRPILVDLQRLRNDLLKQAGALPQDLSANGAAQLLESFADSVELALERADVQVVRAKPGEAFDASRHRAIAVVQADDPAQDATIAQHIADGYFDRAVERIAAPATVTVFRWKENI